MQRQETKDVAQQMINNNSLALGIDEENFVNKEKLEEKKREMLSTLFREREVDSL